MEFVNLELATLNYVFKLRRSFGFYNFLIFTFFIHTSLKIDKYIINKYF